MKGLFISSLDRGTATGRRSENEAFDVFLTRNLDAAEK